MSYNADDHYPVVDRVFSPALYSEETLGVIRAHVGENPAVVMQTLTPDDLGVFRHTFRDVHGKNNMVIETAEEQYQQAFRLERRVVEEALRRFYDLADLAANGVQDWVGVEKVQKSIDVWFERQDKYRQNKRQNPRGFSHHPEFYQYDSKNRAHFQRAGTDVGRVRRWDLPLYVLGQFDGSDFTKGVGDFTSDIENVKVVDPETGDDSGIDPDTGLREGDDFRGCPVCSYQKDYDNDSNDAYNRAGNAVKAHMRAVKKDPEDHQDALSTVSV